MKYIITTFIILFTASCAQTPSKIKPISKETNKDINSCLCMEIYNPVCGSDGRTYANSCTASCQKVSFENGECR